MNYHSMYSLIDEAERLLETHPGGTNDQHAIAEWRRLEAAMMTTSNHLSVVYQKAGAVNDWAAELYRSGTPKCCSHDELRGFIRSELSSMRKALEILQRRPRSGSTDAEQ
jgi:hypothetical protein